MGGNVTKENQTNSVQEYLDYLKRFDAYSDRNELFYRGQLSVFPNMLPTVARNNEYLAEESDIYTRLAIPNKTIIQSLAKMQHDGEPTRLLDMTVDPLVALFFAVMNNKREDSSVYVFIREGLSANTATIELMSFLATLPDRDITVIVKKFNQRFGYNFSEIDIKEILVKAAFITPNTVIDTANHRMQEQKGTFAIPGNKIENGVITGIIPFENDKSYQEIVIPFEFHEQIRKDLADAGYTYDRLFNHAKQPQLNYPSFHNNYYKEYDPRVPHKPYFQFDESIETSTLMTETEIRTVGHLIADNSAADSVWLWFKRPDTEPGINIVTQHWVKESVRDFFPDGARIDDWYLNEDWNDGFVSYEYFIKYPEKLEHHKHLPVTDDAIEVKLDVIYTSSDKIKIITNLFDGAKLFVICSDSKNANSTSMDVVIHKGMATFDIPIVKSNEVLDVKVILTVSTLQSKDFVEQAGIDYERIKGPFLHRDSGMCSGSKEFSLLI